MSLESVRAFLAIRAPDIAIVELDGSTATVALAAAGHGVEPAQIAKTLSLRVRDRNLLLVTRGDARLDNKKAKAVFGGKPRMLAPEEVVAITGHPVGGVSPVRARHAPAGLLRRLAQGLRRSGARRRLDPQRASHQSPAPGRTRRGGMGGRLPERRLAQALLRLPQRSR